MIRSMHRPDHLNNESGKQVQGKRKLGCRTEQLDYKWAALSMNPYVVSLQSVASVVCILGDSLLDTLCSVIWMKNGSRYMGKGVEIIELESPDVTTVTLEYSPS